MSRYAAHAGFVAPALGTATLLHTVVGFFTVEFLYAVGGDLAVAISARFWPDPAQIVWDGSDRAADLYDLYSFVLLGLAVWIVTRLYHRRGLATLIGPRSVAVADFARATLAGGLLFLLMEFVLPWWRVDGAFQVAFWPWLTVLPLALLGLFVQCGAEELFYRGYLQQQIAARFPQPWVWLVVPNLAFAAVHWANGFDPMDSARYVIWAFCFGLAASDLVGRTGSLGAAIGFHLANNIFAFLVVGEEGVPGSALALFVYPFDHLAPAEEAIAADPLLSPLLLSDLGVVFVVWLAVRVAIRR